MEGKSQGDGDQRISIDKGSERLTYTSTATIMAPNTRGNKIVPSQPMEGPPDNGLPMDRPWAKPTTHEDRRLLQQEFNRQFQLVLEGKEGLMTADDTKTQKSGMVDFVDTLVSAE
jgi:hypothetical protein